MGGPQRVAVARRISSRYDGLYRDGRLPEGARPLSWDSRCSGLDVIVTEDGRELKLLSDGGQSPPCPGWMLVLRGGDEESGFAWTLYGMPPSKVPVDLHA